MKRTGLAVLTLAGMLGLFAPTNAAARDRDDYYGRHERHERAERWRRDEAREYREHEWRERQRYYRYPRESWRYDYNAYPNGYYDQYGNFIPYYANPYR